MKLTTEQLLVCADLCVDSYDDHCVPGFCDVDDLRYGVHHVGGVAYVSIRGTANAVNAIRDVWVRPSRVRPGTWAHKGFVSGFDRLRDTDMLLYPWNMPTVFTGHSFGAAVALLFADMTGSPCVTFGCPRPYLRCNGSPNPQHVRIRTDDDPVVAIPAICYHMPTPGQEIVLHDMDSEWLDVKDHSMKIYKRRLERWVKLRKE